MAISEPLVFLGSGPVAAESLRQLHDAGVVFEAVITKPQPSHHKTPFPVLEYAQQQEFTVFTPASKQAITELFQTTQFASRAGLVIDYGFILEPAVLSSFELGIINSHFSLLPKLRGADPITFAILNNEPTGVSLMRIVAEMDAGPLLAQSDVVQVQNETGDSLTAKLIQLSTKLILDTMPAYFAESITLREQPHEQASYTRKIKKQDGTLDLSKPATILEREIRAFQGWPQSRTKIGSVEVIVTSAHVSPQPTELSLVCGDGNHLAIESLKPLGKKEMPTWAFLSGYKGRL